MYILDMKNTSIPHKSVKGLVARLAIQCVCPDTGVAGSFLFSGESYQQKGSRVTPVYDTLSELFPAVKADWQEVVPGNSGYGFIRR